MTFGGIQGFTKAPATPWTNDRGQFAGIVHQERGVTYVLIEGAGHFVAHYQPENVRGRVFRPLPILTVVRN
jgi:carboxypeptidase D